MIQVENALFYGVLLLYFGAMILYFVFVAAKKEGVGKLAQGVQLLGLVLHTGAIVLRGIAAGRLPMTNQYEFAACFAWALCLVSLAFLRKYRIPVLGVFVSPVVFLIMGYAAMQNREVRPLMPALQSVWFVPHVIVYMFAYAMMGAVTLFALYLWLRKYDATDEELRVCDNLVRIGWAFLTLGMIMGALWAKQAWGDYWTWDPKETWAAATWLSYLTYLHLRPREKDQNITFALLIFSFLLLQMCWYGINYLPSAQGSSIHVY